MKNSYLNSIDQVLKIQHYGRFDLFHQVLPDDGKLKKINLIYGPNGSGKTALSLIASSLATGKDSLILKKTSIIPPKPKSPTIHLVAKNTHFIFKNNHWNAHLKGRIKIFNSYFMGDNIYTVNVENNGFSILELMPDEEVSKLEKLTNQIKESEKIRVKYRHYLKNLRNHHTSTLKIIKVKVDINNENNLIQKLKNQYAKLVHPYFCMLINQINKILKEFQADFEVSLNKDVLINNSNPFKISSKILFDVYSANKKRPFSIRDQSKGDISLDYVLSEGDKSSLSFAVYMALMKLIKHPERQIIFVDDPFNSMDSDRRHSTIMYLMEIARKCGQLFITSHDKNFLNDVNKEVNRLSGGKYRDNCLRIQIVKQNHGKSIIDKANFEQTNLNVETLHRLKEFINQDKQYDSFYLKELGQSIRPFLEDAFKFKFPDFYVEGQTWLKNYLDFIRNSDTDPKYKEFRRLKTFLPEFESLLSYTKKFNHSNQELMKTDIDQAELRNEAEHALKLFNAI